MWVAAVWHHQTPSVWYLCMVCTAFFHILRMHKHTQQTWGCSKIAMVAAKSCKVAHFSSVFSSSQPPRGSCQRKCLLRRVAFALCPFKANLICVDWDQAVGLVSPRFSHKRFSFVVYDRCMSCGFSHLLYLLFQFWVCDHLWHGFPDCWLSR